MRMMFSDTARSKAAAKQLTRLSPGLKLATVHEALAQAMGYRDWHELAKSGNEVGLQLPTFDITHAMRLVLAISDALAIDDGDVQFALTKSRLFGSTPVPIHEQLKLRTAILRERVFGQPGRSKPGTVVNVKVAGLTTPAYLRSAGRPSHVIYDSGPGICADFEVCTPRPPLDDFLPARLWLPYGYWTLRDGSEVAFARDYLPLWRIADGVSERLEPWLWINGKVAQRHFTTESDTGWWCQPARNAALAYLERNRIFELPRLANAMRHMIEADIDSVESAVVRLSERSSTNPKFPSYAGLNSNLFGYREAG